MKATSEDIREGIKQGFIEMALCHPYHGDETIQSAIVFAVKQWLNENRYDVLRAITRAAEESE
jgi:hypothetical protein